MPEQTDSFVTAYMQGELDDWFCSPRPPGIRDGQGMTGRPRTELAAVLAGEAGRLGAHRDVIDRARQLADPASRVVVTGQQAGLLLGPLFTLSKTATASTIALNSTREDAPVVPVFWLASQDHDVSEVDHAWLLDMDEHLRRVAIDLPQGVSTGRIPFRQEWLGELQAAFGAGTFPQEFADQVGGVLGEAAAVAQTWADFFTATFYAVLGASAPVVLDPSREEIARLFSGVLAREVEEPLASSAAINDAGARLRAAGHQPQLGRATGATNLFIEEAGDASEFPVRSLLKFDGERFRATDRTYTKQDLLAILEAEPGRITPAAGLRPVTQDAVLPTAAMVVGPGELRYIAQLSGVYRHHGVPQPTIWPRTGVTILEPPVRRILEKYGLSAADFTAAPDTSLERLLLQRRGASESFENSLKRLARERDALLAAVGAIDPTLAGSVEKHAERIGASIELLRSKAGSALVRGDAATSAQFARLASHLLPGGSRQERQLSPFSFFAKFGVEPVMRLFNNLPPGGEVELEI